MKYYNFCSKIPIYRKKVKENENWNFCGGFACLPGRAFFLASLILFRALCDPEALMLEQKSGILIKRTTENLFRECLRRLMSKRRNPRKKFQNQNKVNDYCALYKLCKQKTLKTAKKTLN